MNLFSDVSEPHISNRVKIQLRLKNFIGLNLEHKSNGIIY